MKGKNVIAAEKRPGRKRGRLNYPLWKGQPERGNSMIIIMERGRTSDQRE